MWPSIHPFHHRHGSSTSCACIRASIAPAHVPTSVPSPSCPVPHRRNGSSKTRETHTRFQRGSFFSTGEAEPDGPHPRGNDDGGEDSLSLSLCLFAFVGGGRGGMRPFQLCIRRLHPTRGHVNAPPWESSGELCRFQTWHPRKEPTAEEKPRETILHHHLTQCKRRTTSKGKETQGFATRARASFRKSTLDWMGQRTYGFKCKTVHETRETSVRKYIHRQGSKRLYFFDRNGASGRTRHKPT